MERTCESCRFWERGNATITRGKWKDYAAGNCKRNAPIATGGLHGPEQTLWPQTSVNDWCGEYQPKEQDQ